MDDAPVKKQDAGAPAWVLTFADLMSLLLAFFVLLFSFSEIDKQKFKELAGSLKDAFGVQREIRARETPRGINIIAREFSPGRTEPTPMNQIRQVTTAELQKYAKLDAEQARKQRRKDLSMDLDKVKAHLQQEIANGVVEIEDDGEQVIIIRIREKGSFPSGSAALTSDFLPVIDKISTLVKDIEGFVVVAGHTDDIPIHTARFRSNWELSAARAATVLHQIVEESGEPNTRFRLSGHADTRPIDDNGSAQGRARNRRVEVILLRGAVHEPALGAARDGGETAVTAGGEPGPAPPAEPVDRRP